MEVLYSQASFLVVVLCFMDSWRDSCIIFDGIGCQDGWEAQGPLNTDVLTNRNN